ncbi:hypothetical protein D3C76_1410830 [compost metagenome]
MQAGQAQGLLTASDEQPVLAGAENFARSALPFGQVRRQYLQRFAIQCAVGDRPRVESPNQALQLNRRARPVDARLVLVQLVGVGGKAVVLHFTFQRSGGEAGNRLDHGRRAHFGQTVVQTATGVLGADRRDDFE